MHKPHQTAAIETTTFKFVQVATAWNACYAESTIYTFSVGEKATCSKQLSLI